MRSIFVKLLVFNALLVFIPIFGFFLFNVYEEQLLEALEHALVQQGRLISASVEVHGELNQDYAITLLQAMRQRHDARLRLLDADGMLLADSSTVFAEQEGEASQVSESELIHESEGFTDVTSRSRNLDIYTEGQDLSETDPQDSFLYQLGRIPVVIIRELFYPPVPSHNTNYYLADKPFLGVEIQEALNGRYGSATRVFGGNESSVVLYSALPIRIDKKIVGAVLVSQSTYKLMTDLYAVRRDVFKLFLWSLLASIFISAFFAVHLALPLRRLKKQAAATLDPHGRFSIRFNPTSRKDEIGALNSSLHQLSSRLQEHLDFINSFASDVAHELKNPLASIRSAGEITSSSDDPEMRRKFGNHILSEVDRMESLISSIRDIGYIDANLETEEKECICLQSFFENIQPRYKGLTVFIDQGAALWMSPLRLEQVVYNLLDNALSFGSTVTLKAVLTEGRCKLEIHDDGPGIPGIEKQKIFNRFYTNREAGHDAAGTQSSHTGLGLSIVRAIVRGYGGKITVEDSSILGGACFKISLPAEEGC